MSHGTRVRPWPLCRAQLLERPYDHIEMHRKMVAPEVSVCGYHSWASQVKSHTPAYCWIKPKRSPYICTSYSVLTCRVHRKVWVPSIGCCCICMILHLAGAQNRGGRSK